MTPEERKVFIGILQLLNNHRGRMDRLQSSIASLKVVLARAYTTNETSLEKFLDSFEPLEKEFLDSCSDVEGKEQIDALLKLWGSGKNPNKHDS